MAGSRRRRLSPEERELWERVAASAAPLHRGPTDPAPVPEAPQLPNGVVPQTPLPLPPAIRKPIWEPGTRFDLAPDPHGTSASHPRMDRRRFEKLRRGRLEPEGRLDLHGMTADRAHSALTGFILRAAAQDLRLVLVITGKGRSDESAIAPHRHGILRHSVPHWLSAPPLVGCVLDVLPAHQRHGGSGAYYVYLRRRR